MSIAGQPVLQSNRQLTLYQLVPSYTIQLFHLWPLIPVATGELGSCSNARNILCFCLHPSNLMVREDIVREDETIQTSVDHSIFGSHSSLQTFVK